MDKKKALEVLKACLDEAIKKGICPNLDVASTIFYAYETIKKLVGNDGDNSTGG